MGRARPALGARGRRPRTRLLSRRARGGTHRRDGALGTAASGVVGEARGALGDGVRAVGCRAAAPAVRSPAVGGAREVPRAPRAGFGHRPRRRHRRARSRARGRRRRARARDVRLPPGAHRAPSRRVVSVAPRLDLRAQHRTATIVAMALMAAVATCWSLVPTLARLGTLKPAFAGDARIGYL